ncbi:MAG: hypothetical protein DMF98_27470 [Acidobacteria bacterium]|nr:MAG: hypothetical protein DMF98_27470 [Acidobacteriota bacterium]
MDRVVGFGLCHPKLVGVRETETGPDGRFTLPRLLSSGLDGEGGGEAITIYKFGYVAWGNLFVFPSAIPLKRLPSWASHQRPLSFINGATHARMYGLENVPKFWNAIRPELSMP